MVGVSLLTIFAVLAVQDKVFFDIELGPVIATPSEPRPSEPDPGHYCAQGLDLRTSYSSLYKAGRNDYW